MSLVHDVGPVPAGRVVRRLTGQIQGAREGKGFAALLSEVWYTIITVGLSLTLVAGIASAIEGTVRPPEPGEAALVGELPALLVILAVAGGLLSLAGRLGPVGIGGGGAAWWLPMPVDRRGLLRPTVLTWPVAAAGVGAVVVPLAMLMFSIPVTPAAVVAWACVGGSGFALLVALAAVIQGRGRGAGSTVVAVSGELVMLGAALVLSGSALVGLAPDAEPGSLVPAPGTLLGISAALAVLTVAGTALAERRSGLLDGARLRAKGALGDRARVAVLSLDLRELSRALAASTGRSRRRSLRSVPVGAAQALITADLLLVVRNPRLVTQVLVASLLGAAATGVALLRSGVPLAAVWVGAGFWAATSAAAGARQADLVPALDRLMPLASRTVRLVRVAVPLAASLVWAVVVLGSHARSTGDLMWLGLVPSWALVLACAAVRSAYRPPPRWATSTVVSPMGGLPPTGGAFHGLDMAVLGTLPTTFALYVGHVTSTVVLAQATVAALVLLILSAMANRTGERPAPKPTTGTAPTLKR